MKAIILSVGDELILGQTVDTNSAWLSQQLAQVGVPVLAHITVGDDQNAIEQSIRDSGERCDLLLISGGIGPTPDDLTRQALAAVMNQPLEVNEKWLTELTSFFSKRNRPMPEMNRIQAMIPRGAEMIWNHAGTAAGIHAAIARTPSPGTPGEGRGEGLTGNWQLTTGNSEIFVMPGVPKEMKLMFERAVLKKLKPEGGGGVILSKTLHTFGLGESAVAELLGPLMDRTRNPTVGTTVSGGIVSCRINSKFTSTSEAEEAMADTTRACRVALGALIFGEDDETLPGVVAALLKVTPSFPADWDQSRIDNAIGEVLMTDPQTLPPGVPSATLTSAESCTGGLLAKYLTDIPGSSMYFKQGWITYSNEAKTQLLGVPSSLLQQHGAVSEPVVSAMATGALERSDADFALSISGIAGPDGGTPEKPVGTVCIALAAPDPQSQIKNQKSKIQSRTFLFPGDREMIRDRSAKMALTMLRFHLLGKPLPF